MAGAEAAEATRLAGRREQTTAHLFPERVPEASEAMTPEESASLAAWQASPTGRAVYAAQAQHVIERLAVPGGRVVSVGEGQGRLAWELATRFPTAEVIGVDVCPAVVAAARAAHRADNLRYEVASAYELTAFGPADAVVCVFALHHFERPAAALAAMHDLLAPGGSLYLMDLRRDADAGAYFRRLDEYVAIAPPVAPLFRASVGAAHTRAEVRALLSRFAGDGAALEVGQVRWGAAARAAYRAQDPDQAALTLPGVLQDARGLWCEAVLRRPDEQP